MQQLERWVKDQAALNLAQARTAGRDLEDIQAVCNHLDGDFQYRQVLTFEIVLHQMSRDIVCKCTTAPARNLAHFCFYSAGVCKAMCPHF